MTQFPSATRPLPVGPEYRLKTIPLAVHIASASVWGRPWHRHSLKLPVPDALTFRGFRLSAPALRSWLLMLARAGMLGVRRAPAPVKVASQPVDHSQDAPPKLQGLGFEFASDMVLDFGQLARQARMQGEQESTDSDSAAAQAPDPEEQAADTGVDQLAALAMADSVSADDLDQDFMERRAATMTREDGPGKGPVAEAPPQPAKIEVAEAFGQPEPHMPEVAVALEPEISELTGDGASMHDNAALSADELSGVVPADVVGAQLAAMDQEHLSEANVLQSQRLAQMHAMVMAKSVAQAMPETMSLSASREIPATEDFGPSVSPLSEIAEQHVPEELGVSATRDGEELDAFEMSELIVAKRAEQGVLSIVGVAPEPIAVSETESSDPQAIEGPATGMLVEHVEQMVADTNAEEPVEHSVPPAGEVPDAAAVAKAAVESRAAEQVEVPELQASEVPLASMVVTPVVEEACEPVAADQTELPESQLVHESNVVDSTNPDSHEFVGPPAQELKNSSTLQTVEESTEATIEAELQADASNESLAPELFELPAEDADFAAVLEPDADAFVGPPAPELEGTLQQQLVEDTFEDAFEVQQAENSGEAIGVELSEHPELHTIDDPDGDVAGASAAEPVERREILESKDLAEEHVAEAPLVAAMFEVVTDESIEPAAAEALERAEAPVPDVVMQWEPVEPDQQPELAASEWGEAGHSMEVDSRFDEWFAEASLDPMSSSLEDAQKMGGHKVELHSSSRDSAEPRALRPPESMWPVHFDEPEVSLATLVANTLAAQQITNSNLEAAALQGLFIHKGSEMTEMHAVASDADKQGQSVPITSAELQEVAATLSVPKLDADPDDVLFEVQSTLNSLAGMAQGLTQQKQAAGRLQDELEEWNNQLQERERLASDKEDRLTQLEEHLKQAKTNLDRMTAENNRLLADRSEALKQLAHSVDQRDKATIKRAEAMQIEQQRIDELAASLRSRAAELDERESSLKRKSEELAVRLKQLQSAKDKFSAIVKGFNETVQFNSTLSAISKSVAE